MTAGFGEIDNAEAAVAEVGVTVVKYAVGIGAAMLNGLGHPVQKRGRRLREIDGEVTCYAAHAGE